VRRNANDCSADVVNKAVRFTCDHLYNLGGATGVRLGAGPSSGRHPWGRPAEVIGGGSRAMQGQSNRADQLRKQADKYHTLAEFARPAYLGDFYRRVAVRYLIMAEEVSRAGKVRRENDQAPSSRTSG
jgi:hypothetical protein